MKNYFTTLLLFLTISLSAQDFTLGSSANPTISGIAIADFNGDQYLEVVGRSNATGVVMMINDGTTLPISFTEKNLGLSFDAQGTPAVADLDNDADMDIVFAKGSNFDLYLLSNDGDANFTETALNISGTNVLQVKDIDGDTDLDIIGISGIDNRCRVYINDGNLNFTTVTISLSENGLRRFAAADFDTDGDLDLVLGFSTFGDQIVLYENNGFNGFTALPAITDDFNSLQDLTIADINGDDKMDIIAVQDYSCAAWLNNDNLVFERQNLISGSSSVGIFRSMAIADYNGDDKLDVMLGTNSSDIVWYKNISTDQNPYTYELREVGGVTPAFSLTAGDFDNDEDVDVVVTNGEFFSYENQIEQGDIINTFDLLNLDLAIYPNPFQDRLQIEHLTPLDYQLQVSDVYGKVVFSTILQSATVDLSNLESGVYFISIQHLESRAIQTATFVKGK